MIPNQLKILVEQQPGDIRRINKELAIQALRDLDISLESEFAQFFQEYKITLFQSIVSDEALCDIAEPTPEIKAGTQFVHEVWELPENFICFTTVEGEGGYLYDKVDGSVYDFELGKREELISGRMKPRWNSFFEFMTWYLGAKN